MATWDDVREHLRKKLTIAVEEASWIGLGWTFKSEQTGMDVLQRQRIELVQAIGEPHLMILCDIVEVARARPDAMLVHNMTLAVGSIAASDGWYVMKAVTPLETIDLRYFERSLTYLAHEAARLRELIPAAPTS
jgi:hypothetical protein